MAVATQRKPPRHPASIRRHCRRLYDDYDRTPTEIREALSELGYSPLPSWGTIRCWVDPEYRHARLASARRLHKHRRGASFTSRTAKRGWHYRLERMQKLRAIGLSYRSIAKLFAFDFDLALTASQVEGMLRGEISARTVRRLLWPEEST